MWHPVRPIPVSDGSEGAIFRWDPSLPTAGTPSNSQPPIIVRRRNLASIARPPALSARAPQTSPRATLSQAHELNVWALNFHPFGHLLVSASNDHWHTTRFWACERPGDAASLFSPRPAKPAAAGSDDDPDGEPEDEDDALAIPGFGGRHRVILPFTGSALALLFMYLFLSLAHALQKGECRSYCSFYRRV